MRVPTSRGRLSAAGLGAARLAPLPVAGTTSCAILEEEKCAPRCGLGLQSRRGVQVEGARYQFDPGSGAWR